MLLVGNECGEEVAVTMAKGVNMSERIASSLHEIVMPSGLAMCIESKGEIIH